MAQSTSRLSYAERLQTFLGCYWDYDMATARQLAAIGHASDRPPLESLEEGSRCISCSLFITKDASTELLDGHAYDELTAAADFHHPRCERLSIRIPCYELLPTVERTERRRLRLSPETQRHRLGREIRDNALGSHFWKLPIELRLQIYSLVMGNANGNSMAQRYQPFAPLAVESTTNKQRTRTRLNVPLLQTCRQIHDEALGDVYQKTRFQFESTMMLYIFLRRIGTRGRRLLRSVEVRCGQRGDAVTFALLACCDSLTSMTIGLPRPRLVPPRASLWVIEGISTLLDIGGLASVEFCGSEVLGELLVARGSLDATLPDARILKKELMRPRGSPGSIRFVNGIPDV